MPTPTKAQPETTPQDAPAADLTPETSQPAHRVHPNIVAALAAFQRTLPAIRKTNTADVKAKSGAQFSYTYADLTDISEVVLPALAEEGLAFHCALDTDLPSRSLILRWALMHADSPESFTGMVPVGTIGQDWQSLGSAETYARRYALIAATGVAPGGDDDDAATPGATAGTVSSQPIARPKEYLPEGLYALEAIATVEDARKIFRQARAAGHLHMVVGIPQGDGTTDEQPLGAYLTKVGEHLPEDAAAAAELAEQEVIRAHDAEQQAKVDGE